MVWCHVVWGVLNIESDDALIHTLIHSFIHNHLQIHEHYLLDTVLYILTTQTKPRHRPI